MLTIDEKRHYLPIWMNYLAEGNLAISEPMEVASYLQIITAPMIHIGGSVEIFSADEECIFQIDVTFEGRDNNDKQDAQFISHIFTAYSS